MHCNRYKSRLSELFAEFQCSNAINSYAGSHNSNTLLTVNDNVNYDSKKKRKKPKRVREIVRLIGYPRPMQSDYFPDMLYLFISKHQNINVWLRILRAQWARHSFFPLLLLFHLTRFRSAPFFFCFVLFYLFHSSIVTVRRLARAYIYYRCFSGW